MKRSYSGYLYIVLCAIIFSTMEVMLKTVHGVFAPMQITVERVLIGALFLLPFALRMIKAAFYAIDEELEDAARNLGASPLVTFLRVKLPIVLPSVLAVFALNFNALFTEYDMSATFHSSYGKSYAMVIQNMCAEEGRDGYNVNASGRRCASTVFIMIVSGLILYLVYGVGARDLGDRLAIKEKRRKRWEKFSGHFKKEKKIYPNAPCPCGSGRKYKKCCGRR